MIERILISFVALFFIFQSNTSLAQMPAGNDTLFGNEWINFSQQYYKIKIIQNGIYRIGKQSLQDLGIDLTTVKGNNFQIFNLGQEIPIHTSTNNVFANTDYIEFYGKKLTSEIDKFLYKNGKDEMLNPYYSNFNDTSVYYLTFNNSTTNKRINNIAFDIANPATPISQLKAESLIIYKDVHFKPNVDGNPNIFYSNFQRGEGYGRPPYNKSTIDIEAKGWVPGSAAKLIMNLIGNKNTHALKISFNNQFLLLDSSREEDLRHIELNIPANIMKLNNVLVLEGTPNVNDNHIISYIKLDYTSGTDAANTDSMNISLPINANASLLTLANFKHNNQEIIGYDLIHNERYASNIIGNDIKIRLNANTQEREIKVQKMTLLPTTSINKYTFNNDYTPNSNFIIISNKKLFSNNKGINYVQEYANYRKSAVGGSNNVSILEIDDIYNQFGYGTQNNSIAIRNLIHYLYKKGGVKNIFLIGKAREYNAYRTAIQQGLRQNESFFIPTFGYPGADNLFSASNTTLEPTIPIGRLAVSNPDEISTYLDKVKEYEYAQQNTPQNIAAKSWMKKALHLGGGNVNEALGIKIYLQNIESVLNNNMLGYKVTSFYKSSTDPVQGSVNDKIFETINDGVSQITFFGHTSSSTFEFNFDNPDLMKNKGKYPLVFALGCYTGNVHTAGKGLSENFLFYKDKGSIAFIASSWEAYGSPLSTITTEFYTKAGSNYYGKGIGEILKASIGKFENTTDRTFIQLSQQFTLHGDPSLKLNSADLPDFTLEKKSVQFVPDVLNAALDSFDIKFSLNNLGKYILDSMTLLVEQQYPDGNKAVLSKTRIPTVSSEENIRLRLPMRMNAYGNNKFFITVDSDNNIQEGPTPFAENNNQLIGGNNTPGLEVFIVSNSAKTLYPYNYAIVNKPPTLKATSGNALAPKQNYFFELDTLATFNTTFLKKGTVNQKGGVVEWLPNTIWNAGKVYYWRVSADTLGNTGFVWEASSFIYLPNTPSGWNQSHFDQFSNDKLNFLNINRKYPVWSFGDNYQEVTVDNYVQTKINSINQSGPVYKINNSNKEIYFGGWDIDQGVYVAVLDSVNLVEWLNSKGVGKYGSTVMPTFRQRVVFPYDTKIASQRQKLMQFLEDTIPDNNIVILYTIQNDFINDIPTDYAPYDWANDSIAFGTNLFKVLEKQGATKVRELAKTSKGVPYLIIYKKGVGLLSEVKADSITERINRIVTVKGFAERGTAQSTIVGPAKLWNKLEWKYTNSKDGYDFLSVKVLGKNIAGTYETLIDSIVSSSVDLSTIDAKQYPELKLEFLSVDSKFRTTAQLDYWRVLYKPIPEGALDGNAFVKYSKDTLDQGEPLEFSIAYRNISEEPMDSVLISYDYAKDNSGNVVTYRAKNLVPNDTIIINIKPDTKTTNGINRLSIDVNPNGDQPEQFHFNNVVQKIFNITRDVRNPYLDVTFDGVKILDGDIVSPKPKINITLKDENKYLILNDSSLLDTKIYELKSGGNRVLLNIDPSLIQFYPATDTKNKASIEIDYRFVNDGRYLLVVNAKDISGNKSGQIEYTIGFQVVNKSQISNVFVYPNPFSTSAQFVYTLTGEEVPANMKIQILTMTGKVVKEITNADLGTVRIGTQRSEYKWDGTDEYGDKLANGVYLYKVTAKKADGSNYENFENNTDVYFKNGIGKLVIMR
jgi:Peptidase family C25/FlgD Ig-like domain